MGRTVTVSVQNIPPQKVGFYATGFSSPTWTHLGDHCQTVLDLSKPILLTGIRPNALGIWSLTFGLPTADSR